MMQRLTVLLILLASVAQADVPRLPALYDVVGLNAGDVLVARRLADANSEAVGSIAADQTGVEVVDLAADGTWAEVNVDGMAGYVPLEYLEPVQKGAWSELATPLRCAGTEPFWGVQIDPLAMTATYSAREEMDVPLSISRVWSQGSWPQGFDPDTPVVFRFAERNALAFLTPGICSDGMSDQSYGININLFVTDPGAEETIWTGCCSMAP